LKFLHTDISALRTDEQFHQAFRGLQALYAILGPKGASYRHTIELMEQALKEQRKAVADLVPAQFYREVDRVWRQVCSKLQAYIPPDLWAEIEGNMMDLFAVEGINRFR